MNSENQNQAKARCLGFSATMNRVASSDASRHLGTACREVLLAIRTVVDAAIDRQEKKAEVKLQKVTIE
jgi:predicted RNA-binding protein YlqC (UPF0109 family)